jgi:hypothetical protein
MLARLNVDNLLFRLTLSPAGMHLFLSVPTVSIFDIRQTIEGTGALPILGPAELFSKLHTAGGAASEQPTLLLLEFFSGVGGDKRVAACLQNPHLILDMSFTQQLLRFFVPTFGGGDDATVTQVLPRDIDIRGKYTASRDVTLSRSRRLLADSKSHSTLEYNGCGHRLVLPSAAQLASGDAPCAPAIFVGAHCTLRLRNVRVVNSDSLHTCVVLGPFASITTDKEDGVVLDALGMGADAAEAGAAASARTLQAPQAADTGTMALTVRVVGFTLQLYEMSAAATAAARLLEMKLGLSLQLETSATGLALSAGLTGTAQTLTLPSKRTPPTCRFLSSWRRFVHRACSMAMVRLPRRAC